MRSGSGAGSLIPFFLAAGLLAIGSLAACGPGEVPPSTDGVDASSPEVGDSLVVLLLRDSVAPARVPRDWVDLLHPRFGDQVVFPDPGTSREARAFMEAVLRAEAARTGDPEAGFDWLRRLDGVVLLYARDPADGEAAFRRGQAVLLVTDSRRAARLLREDAVRLAPMESGAAPFPAVPAPDTLGSVEPPDLPPGWLTTWSTEVRGTG